MLKAAIIYLQGTGGNLVARSLSLTSGTVAYLPQSLALQQSNLDLPLDQRFKIYNNWDSTNWIKSELDIGMWYHHGYGDFVELENTNLQLIDQFHPCMFENENNKKILWSNIEAWKHIIFIKYRIESLNQITRLAKIKRTDLNHIDQISKEIVVMKRLLLTIPNHLEIWWEDMLQLESYITAIKRITDTLNLSPNVELISALWKNWNLNTQLIYERS
jgi:hypothetical protein